MACVEEEDAEDGDDVEDVATDLEIVAHPSCVLSAVVDGKLTTSDLSDGHGSSVDGDE